MCRPRGLSNILISAALLASVLMWEGGAHIRTFFSFGDHEIPNKKIEIYWQETNLNEKNLFEVVNNKLCYTTEAYFLSCVNSVRKAFLSKSIQTEKISLENTKVLYKAEKIDFESLWLTLMENQDNKAAMIAAGLNGFLSSFKDPHTYIMPALFQNAVHSASERSKLFVGISFEEKKPGQIFIRKVFKSSDAEKAGLKRGDQILAFNNQEMNQLSVEKISQTLKSEQVSQFEFKVKRDGHEVYLQISRSFKPIKFVQTELVEGFKSYAVITLSKFTSGVCSEVKSQLETALNQKPSGVVLDLRDNPGGYLEEASCIAGLFVGKDQLIYSVKYLNPLQNDEVSLTTSKLMYSGPLAILINSSSASASELLAGALKEYGRAVLVGERTFGKGTFQESETWIKNPQINLYKTMGFYLLPSGDSTQLKGVVPDIYVQENETHRREEDLYFNPMHAHNTNAENKIAKVKFNLMKIECIADNTLSNEDKLLEKGLQTVACQNAKSTIAVTVDN